MARASIILSLFAGTLLFGCDRALDDRYEGLVVVPVQEAPAENEDLIEYVLEPEITLVEVDVPRRRPDSIPLRDLTPNEAAIAANEAAIAANEAALTASIATDNLLAAQTAEAEALARLSELQTDLNQIQNKQDQFDLQIVPITDDDEIVIAIDTENPTLDISASSVDPKFSNDPTVSGLPKNRPTAVAPSFDQLEAFLAEQAALAEQAERERLAAERAEAERLAQEAAEAARRAQEAAALEKARQEAAEVAAAEAAAEAERLAGLVQSIDQATNPVPEPITIDTISLPLTYNTSAPIGSIQDLQGLYDKADYSLAEVIVGQPVPALILQRLPKDLSVLGATSAPLQKELFVKAVLPLCLVTNARIQQERDYILAINDVGENLSQAINPVIRGLGAKYRASSQQELLTKVQTIPVSLCLSYAIAASEWGGNVISLNQNALFGPWARSSENSSQLFPSALLRETESRSVLFNSLQSATDAFALFLNRHETLADFREERDRSTQQNQLLSGLVAAEYIYGLAPRDGLTSRLIQTIRDNRLNQYNLARLEDGPRRAIPVL